MRPPEKHFRFLNFQSHKQSDSATVNHQVGGSSPSRGAISNSRLTPPVVVIGADQENISHRVGDLY